MGCQSGISCRRDDHDSVDFLARAGIAGRSCRDAGVLRAGSWPGAATPQNRSILKSPRMYRSGLMTLRFTRHSDSAVAPTLSGDVIALYSSKKYTLHENNHELIETDISCVFPPGMCGLIIAGDELIVSPTMIKSGHLINILAQDACPGKCSDNCGVTYGGRWEHGNGCSCFYKLPAGSKIADMIVIPYCSISAIEEVADIAGTNTYSSQCFT